MLQRYDEVKGLKFFFLCGSMLVFGHFQFGLCVQPKKHWDVVERIKDWKSNKHVPEREVCIVTVRRPRKNEVGYFSAKLMFIFEGVIVVREVINDMYEYILAIGKHQ